ncbi:MAG: polysaccharide deacetylase family protein [Bryobacteraceae bacterium]|nr:polysaccharide deacetylase family protein [Bryobacteraceae bacterium]
MPAPEPAFRSAILTYHSIDNHGSVLSVSPETFRRQLEWLAASGIPVAPLSQIREQRGAVALTFDDGYRNFAETAWPLLRRYGFPATVFVVAGKVGGRNDWPALGRHVPALDLMEWDELQRVVREGAAVGSHDLTHAPNLALLEEAPLRERLSSSRAILEDRLGVPVRSFAYPYGKVNARLRRAVADCYETGCTTELDFVTPGADSWLLPRIDAYYVRNLFWFQRLVRPSGSVYIRFRRRLRRLRREALMPKDRAL